MNYNQNIVTFYMLIISNINKYDYEHCTVICVSKMHFFLVYNMENIPGTFMYLILKPELTTFIISQQKELMN